MLTNLQIKNAKPAEKVYKLFDGNGLFVLIHPNGSKYWRIKYRFNGKECLMSLGSYPDVSIIEAREALITLKKQIKAGIDPKKSKAMPDSARTFKAAAELWYARKFAEWSVKHQAKMRSFLVRRIYPFLGDMQLDEIKAPDVILPINKLIDEKLFDSAKTIRGMINQVFSYAIQIGLTENNPAFAMRHVISAPKPRHMPAFTNRKDLANYLRNIDVYQGSTQVKAALRFLPLVFVRPGELRRAEWKEIDFDNAEWRIPAEKMKMKEEHVVPLSRQALKILSDLKIYTGESPYVFPSARTNERPMSENAFNVALRSMGYEKDEVTGHGFRATASTFLNELGFSPDIIERQLAHAERNKVKSAYNRASHLDKRREMMQFWSDYLEKLVNE